MASKTDLFVFVFLCVWFTILDLSNSCIVSNFSTASTSVCLPKDKCLKSSQLTLLNLFCTNGEICCLKTPQIQNNFKIYSALSRVLLGQNEPNILNNNEQVVSKENISRHLLSKRAIPINTAPLYAQNQPLGLVYMYPFPIARHNGQQNRFNQFFKNMLIKPVEDRLNIDISNRIINKNESKSHYFNTISGNQEAGFTFANKKPLQKDIVVFDEKEYQLDDPFAEKIKRNFERYLKEERNRASEIKFSDSFIDDRIASFKYSPGIKSIRYCQDYEQYVNNKTSKTIRHRPNELSYTSEEKSSCSHPIPLIVGGLKAHSGEFPHMAGLGFDRGLYIEFLCGGSLISPRFVLTAAHCAKTKWGSPVIVRLGVNNIIGDGGQNIDVEKIILHPDYKPPACYNDIALIQIVVGIKLGPNLRPACLLSVDTTANEPKKLVTATGWGRTGYGKFSSPSLLKVTLQIIGKQECDKSFSDDDTSNRLTDGIVDSMICASGYLKPSHDTCQGDSGGPIQSLLSSNECMHQIVGITSFGKLCGKGLPGVYTKVSAFLPWIEDNVWPS